MINGDGCRSTVDNTYDRRRAVVKFLKSGVWDEVPEGSTIILEIAEFPYKTVYDESMDARVP